MTRVTGLSQDFTEPPGASRHSGEHGKQGDPELLAALGVYSYAQVTAQRDAADAERDAARVAQAGAEASRRETRV